LYHLQRFLAVLVDISWVIAVLNMSLDVWVLISRKGIQLETFLSNIYHLISWRQYSERETCHCFWLEVGLSCQREIRNTELCSCLHMSASHMFDITFRYEIFTVVKVIWILVTCESTFYQNPENCSVM
jgi:hypothetical protein